MKKMTLVLLMLIFGSVSSAYAADEPLFLGQTLYLPIYSHMLHGDRVTRDKVPLTTLLSALVSIRNTNSKTPIRVTSAKYYNTDGKLLKEYLRTPAVIGALGTFELFLERTEAEGGSGANFIIQWDSVSPANPPVVEAVHADIRTGSSALAFITTARPILPNR